MSGRRRHGAAHFFGGFDPDANGVLDVGDRFLLRFAVAHASRKIRDGSCEPSAVLRRQRFDYYGMVKNVHK